MTEANGSGVGEGNPSFFGRFERDESVHARR
jgi:hypothetical protein